MTPTWTQPRPDVWQATLCTFDMTLEVVIAAADSYTKETYFDYEITNAGNKNPKFFRLGKFSFNGATLTTLEAAQAEAWSKACEWAGVEQ